MSNLAIAWKEAVITPTAAAWPSLWMTGYGWDKRKNNGIIARDLYAQCVVIYDNGTPNVLLRVDVLGLPRDVHQAIRQRVVGEGLVASSDFLIATSHTHSGPYIGVTHPNPSILLGLEPVEIDTVNKATNLFIEQLVDLVRRAVIAKPVAATLHYSEGEVEIGFNRAELTIVLKNVPVLLARKVGSGAPLAVLFGYACHPVSRGNDDVFDSDYCGYASEAIKARLGIPAFFFQGAAGDQEPYHPHNQDKVVELGEKLAQAVINVIKSGTFTPVTGPIVTELIEIDLPFAVDMGNPRVVAELKAKYQARIDDPKTSAWAKRHAEVVLEQIREARLPRSIPMPIQRWRFDGLTLLALAHEALSGYQIKLKELTSQPLWLMAYANETQCYVPTDEKLWKGGYEAGWNDDPEMTGIETAMMSYTWPAPLASSPPNTRPPALGSVERIVIDACQRLLNDGWKHRILFPADGATDRGIAAVALNREDMNLWWISEIGSVKGAQWIDGNWHDYWQAPPSSADTGGRIAAVSRKSNTMELWWIAPDSSVRGAYWYDGMRRAEAKPYVLVPAGQASRSGGIAAVSRKPNTMELWWIARDGSVHGAYWYEGMTSWEHYLLAPEGSASTNNGSTITAVSRKAETMEVWWTQPDGSVRGAYWYEGMDSWMHYVLASEHSASTSGAMVAVSRKSNTMELWWITPEGGVHGAHWYEGMETWGHYTLVSAGASVTGDIAAVSRKQNTMELWFIGDDASIRGAYWYEGMDTWCHYMLAAPGSTPFRTGYAASGSIAAVSRSPDTMTVFWIGNQTTSGTVYSAEWTE